MSPELFIKFILSGIEFSAMVALSLSLFRIPFRYQLGRVVAAGFLMSAATYYIRDIAGIMELALVIVLLGEVILLMLLFQLPIFYSLLVSVSGYLLTSILELGVIQTGTFLDVTRLELVATSVIHLGGVLLSVAALLLLIVYLLQSRKLGFMFVASRLTMRQALKGYNFYLSGFLIACFLVMQLALLYYRELSLHYIMLCLMSVVFLITVYYSYRHNKRLLAEKYERSRFQ